MSSRLAGDGPAWSQHKRESLYELLKNRILSGDLKPGEPLVEEALAAWHGVSRTPIREALRRLQQDGLIERGDRGMAVRERSPEEILDIFETRMVLEGMAGRVAADRRTNHDLRLIKLLVRRGYEVGDDTAARVEINEQFHRTIWQASHNQSLVDLLERLSLHLARYPGTQLGYPGRWEVVVDEHRDLAEAIERREADVAHAIALRHFAEARDIRLAIFL